jgi:hypothetical protein
MGKIFTRCAYVPHRMDSCKDPLTDFFQGPPCQTAPRSIFPCRNLHGGTSLVGAGEPGVLVVWRINFDGVGFVMPAQAGSQEK